MRVFGTIAAMSEACRSAKRPIGLVPTMGYLHQGHLALVQRARRENLVLAISVFVNPIQFGPSEDFPAYPRDIERDLALLKIEDVDLVFAPSVAEMYPQGMDTWVEVHRLSERLEGEYRTGHLRGVATVVSKLLNIVRPDRAYFGQKDGQQTAVVRRLVKDLSMGVDVVVVKTVRDADGLAISSRNVYLSEEERRAAPVIHQALTSAQRLWERGQHDGDLLRAEVRGVLEEEPLVGKIDYVSIADPDTFDELTTGVDLAMVSVAVWLGKTRLIDNVLLAGC